MPWLEKAMMPSYRFIQEPADPFPRTRCLRVEHRLCAGVLGHSPQQVAPLDSARCGKRLSQWHGPNPGAGSKPGSKTRQAAHFVRADHELGRVPTGADIAGTDREEQTVFFEFLPLVSLLNESIFGLASKHKH
jgi:hypothetical protein